MRHCGSAMPATCRLEWKGAHERARLLASLERDSVTALPSGTVTFLFTDIESSTRRWEQHRDEMEGAVVRHDALVRKAIEVHLGVVFKTMGDAFCAAFNTPRNALSAAID